MNKEEEFELDEKEPFEEYSEYFKDLIENENRYEETVSNIEGDDDDYIDSLPY